MGKIACKAGTLLAPVPAVLVTCGTMAHPNVLTVAWTGTVCTDPPKTYISLRKERFSHDIIRESGEFVLNLVNKKLAVSADYCGMKSGKDTDKFAAMHLDAVEAQHVSCPLIGQSPLSLECRVTDIIPLGSHDLFLADILGVDVDEQYLDANGRICLDEAMLVAYNHGEYFLLGDKIGKFGYSLLPKNKRRKITRGESDANPKKA